MPTITGSDGAETLRGTRDKDVIDALGGNDTVYASRGEDRVDGGDGFDVLRIDLTDRRLFGAISGPFDLAVDFETLTSAAAHLATHYSGVEIFRIPDTGSGADTLTVDGFRQSDRRSG